MDNLATLRRKFHRDMCRNLLGYRTSKKSKIPNFADSSSKTSTALAEGVLKELGLSTCNQPPKAQRAGKYFTDHCVSFLQEAFSHLQHLRPGDWSWSVSQASIGIAAYEQYAHLYDLQKALENNPKLKTALGGDYLITPDILLSRKPLLDSEINPSSFVHPDSEAGLYSPLRAQNQKTQHHLLHASISCKWTLRSDRAQNARSEALNLVRNRKGNTPRIVFVTMEPLPSRIASIALGTGDLDCCYHGALHELIRSTTSSRYKDQLELLLTMVDGKRLRDISDLPLDLAI